MISVCIVNYARYRVLHEGKFLTILPNTIKALAEASVGLDVELVIANFQSYEPPFNEWLPQMWWSRLQIIPVGDFFSSGRGRNFALQAAQGDIIVMIDADMIVPTNFLQIIQKQVLAGNVCCPLYSRQMGPESTKFSDGNGYGNVAFSRHVGLKMLEKYNNQPWPEFRTWGSEDVIFVQRIVNDLHLPVWREMINGFYHQWHPKTSEWYQKKKGITE